MMTISRAIFACACVAAMMQPVFGQETTAAKPGIPGVVDPKTGVFTATPRVVADENVPAAAITPTTGKLVVSFTVKLVTPLPAGGSLLCSVFASVLETTSSPPFGISAEITEEASTKATVAGSTATCKVSIPYSWNLTHASTDTASLQYSLVMVSSTVSTATLARSSSQNVVPGAGAIKVPANGMTSNFAVAATI
jgi:hypothetical protein